MSKLSIVVPCHNEEAAIPIFYDVEVKQRPIFIVKEEK